MQRVFLNSFPKSGTNLAEKLLRSMAVPHSGRSIALSSLMGRREGVKRVLRGPWYGRPVPIGLEADADVSDRWLASYLDRAAEGSYVSGHAAWSAQLQSMLEARGFRTILVVRDLRAVLSSWSRYVIEPANAWYPFHGALRDMDRRARLRALLDGMPGPRPMHPFAVAFERLARWATVPGVEVVRFEDLVGEAGGGDRHRQVAAIERIRAHIGVPGDDDVRRLGESLFGGTSTFRAGSVDGWARDLPDWAATEVVSRTATIWSGTVGGGMVSARELGELQGGAGP